MIVVSDTSVLSALLSIRRTELLQAIFGEVVVPTAVGRELRAFHRDLPDFVHQQHAHDEGAIRAFAKFLDPGEAEAIVLAKELSADYLLMDERTGRAVALREGLRVIGVLGVVGLAKRQGLISSARAVITELRSQGRVFLSDSLVESVLRDLGESG